MELILRKYDVILILKFKCGTYWILEKWKNVQRRKSMKWLLLSNLAL